MGLANFDFTFSLHGPVTAVVMPQTHCCHFRPAQLELPRHTESPHPWPPTPQTTLPQKVARTSMNAAVNQRSYPATTGWAFVIHSPKRRIRSARIAITASRSKNSRGRTQMRTSLSTFAGSVAKFPCFGACGTGGLARLSVPQS